MLDIIALILLLRSPTWLLTTLGTVGILFGIAGAIGWRATLAIPGYPLLFGGFLLMFFVGRHGAYTTLPWWMMGIGGVLSFPLLNAQDRQQRAQREATRKVEANRLRPINPTWTNAILAFGALPGIVVGAVIGYQLFGPNGAPLGIIPLVALPAWAIIRERKRLKAVPKGVVGQTKEGLYVYDLDELKKEQVK